MRSSIEMILFASVIGLLTAISRGGHKGVEVHRVRAMLGAGVITVILSILYIYFGKITVNIEQLQQNIRYITIPALCLLLTRPLVIVGFQKGFSVSSFPIVYSLFGLLFTILLGLLFFKEMITVKQGIGVICALVAVVLLK